jgi:hypothetical protein
MQIANSNWEVTIRHAQMAQIGAGGGGSNTRATAGVARRAL